MANSHVEHPGQWDERFSVPEYVYGEEPNDFIREVATQHLSAPLTALCLCEGEGRNAVWLAEQGHKVTNVDLSPVALGKCRALAERRGVAVATHQSDMSDYQPEPESADLVVMVFAHTPAAVRPILLRHATAALRPGGHILLECYTADQIGRGTGGPPVPEMMYSLAELTESFANFDVFIGREIVREVVEGKYHTGDAAVVQFFAQKPSSGA